jgi:hypothetical protein
LSSHPVKQRELPLPVRRRRARNARRGRNLQTLGEYTAWAITLGAVGLFLAIELLGALTRA